MSRTLAFAVWIGVALAKLRIRFVALDATPEDQVELRRIERVGPAEIKLLSHLRPPGAVAKLLHCCRPGEGRDDTLWNKIGLHGGLAQGTWQYRFIGRQIRGSGKNPRHRIGVRIEQGQWL